MKAVVIEAPHDVVYRDVEAPTCGPDDVLVRSRCAGVCRTDVEMATGEFVDPRWVRFPCIPGHEWSGTIAEIGVNVTDLALGKRVVCEGAITCGSCPRCRSGDTQFCERSEQIGFTSGGGYGELVRVPRRLVHSLPDAVSFEAATLIEPASVVLQGLLRAQLLPGEAVGVIGVGTLGSLTLRLARLYSPRTIVAYGIRPEELELARRLGADDTVLVDRADAELRADGAFGELDLVVETAGAVSALQLAARLPRAGGRALLLGIAGEGKTVELPADWIAMNGVALIGSISYTSAAWSRVVDLVRAGLVDFQPIVTHRFRAREFEQAFRLMNNREGVVGKVVLEHR